MHYATPVNMLFLATAGACTGVLGALLGTGGGVFLIPVLVLGFGVPMHYAIATSIVSVVATSSAVAGANVERGTANMRLGMALETATVMGAITGGLTAASISPRLLELLFAVVVLPTAASMWRGREGETHGKPATAGDATLPTADVQDIGLLGGRFQDPQSGREVAYHVDRLWAGLAVALVAGNLSGLLGIGGGVFKVPALHLLCNVPMKAAAATSNFMIGVTAAASAFLYFGRGEVRPVLTATVVLGVLAGSVLGMQLSPRVHGKVLNRLFAVVLVGVAVQMLGRVFLVGE